MKPRLPLPQKPPKIIPPGKGPGAKPPACRHVFTWEPCCDVCGAPFDGVERQVKHFLKP